MASLTLLCPRVAKVPSPDAEPAQLRQVYETDYKTAKAEKALHEGGYRTTTIRGPPSYLPGWVAGSPEEDLTSSGGDVCDERFFRWWLEETSPKP